MRIPIPNFTQTPNDLFDHWLPLLKEVELKVLLVILRKTFGWHKTRDRISLSQLEKLTGATQTNIIIATKSLIEKGVITKEVSGSIGQQVTHYELVMQEGSNISDPSQVEGGPLLNKWETPPKSGDTKETLTKETLTKETPIKQRQQKENVVVDDQVNLFYKSSSGEVKSILTSEIHRQFIRKNLDFKPEIIEQAIQEVRQKKPLVGNIISLLSTICYNLINNSKSDDCEKVERTHKIQDTIVDPTFSREGRKTLGDLMRERTEKEENERK